MIVNICVSFQEVTKGHLKGFERKLIPEKIIGATDNVSEDGQLHFLIKWFVKFLKLNCCLMILASSDLVL
jgi:hypothetical protein